MSIIILRHHRVNCDSCGYSEEFTGCSNIQQVRFQAYTNGWTFKDNKSYCKNCSDNVHNANNKVDLE